MPNNAPFARIAAALSAHIDDDELSGDLTLLTLFASDIFFTGRPPAAIYRPRSIHGLARAVAACADAGIPVVPRGGGLSYSAGFVTQRDDVLMLDLRGLDAIGVVDAERRFVTVEAGCTWSRLRDHLAQIGLRPCFWGPASGQGATIGGTLAQEAVLLGSGRHGAAGETLLGLTLLAADGRLVTIPGPDGEDPREFVGDCGALGVKVEITLRLEPIPAETAYRAFRFETAWAGLDALSQTGAARLVSECFLFDRWSRDQQRQAGPDEVWIESLPGQRHRSGAMFELHAAFEAETGADLGRIVSAFEDICLAHAGAPMGEGALGGLHQSPFGPPWLMLGPGGRRWLPVHFIVPHQRLHDLDQAIHACVLAHAALIKRHDLAWGWSALAIGGDHVLVEPSLYWKDVQPEQVKIWFDPAVLAARPAFAADPEARAAVASLRMALVDAGRTVGAQHIQIGRFYPPDAAFARWTLPGLAARKRSLDPQGLMNPGVLGLG